MFISHTTLQQSLNNVRRKFSAAEPFIGLTQRKNEVFFERDEYKIREILTRLTHEDWDYSKKGNAYYSYHFIDEQIIDFAVDTIPILLQKYNILMEDPLLVYLDISVAVMNQRFGSGHPLPAAAPLHRESIRASRACEELFELLKDRFGRTFPPHEQDAIYELFSLGDPSELDITNPVFLSRYVDSRTRQLADLYLKRIRSVFSIDFSGDRDFYITLTLYIRDLQRSRRIYNSQDNAGFTKERLLDEMEIAMLFQPIAEEYLSRTLTEIELINLAHCISGGLEFLFKMHPEYKLRTVICGHRNRSSLWSSKRDVLGAFSNYLDITSLIPANRSAFFDFSGTDLVLTTVEGVPVSNRRISTIPISYILTEEDRSKISEFITQKRIEWLCPAAGYSAGDLLRDAIWHEKERFSAKEKIVELLCRDLSGISVDERRLFSDIMRREEITSFVTGPGIVFLHSLLPSDVTRLSIATMDHRVMWNGHKIRTIVMGVFRSVDIPLLFQLKHLFHVRDIDGLSSLKTREEIMDFFGFSENTQPL